MIPKGITAPFRWWAKHPWIVFWGITFLGSLIIIIPKLSVLSDFGPQSGTLLHDLLVFVYGSVLLLLLIAWILSWCRGVFVTWQRSKIRAVLAFSPFAILLIIQMMFSHHPHYNPDSDVKSNLKNAATSQEAYFVDHDIYTSNVGSLTGFNQSANVNITMEATMTTYIITGTWTKGCKPNTGTWSFNSTTGEIDGTPCR